MTIDSWSLHQEGHESQYGKEHIILKTHGTKRKRLIAALGAAAAAAVAPAALFAGAGSAHAAPCYAADPAFCFTTINESDLGSVTASDPGGSFGGINPPLTTDLGKMPELTPSPGAGYWNTILPGCATLDALDGECGN
jgi:hypothetical protein